MNKYCMYCMNCISDHKGTKKGSGAIKRTRRFRPDTKALIMEIRKFQKSGELLIKAPFARY